MTKALVTFANGPHEELLEIALPSFHEFADRHDYEVVIPDPLACSRPTSWWKVPTLIHLLHSYDEALWIDADVVITDPSEDLPVPADAWQAMVEHHTRDEYVPNCGVWYLRPPMIPYLKTAWERLDLIDHGWWEQAAMIDQMGYRGRPSTHRHDTELYLHTCFLDAGWNVHPSDKRKSERPRFMHATMLDDRAGAMRAWAELVPA